MFGPQLDVERLSVKLDDKGQQTQNSPRTVHRISVLILGAMLGSTFLYAFDGTIVVNVGPHIIEALGGLEKLPWLGTAFTWATMATILVWSKLYTIFDAKWLYVIGSIIFEVGSALCGAAPNIDSMIVSRGIAGSGASGIYIGSLTLLIVVGLGFVLGPIIGAAFAESKATWRWAFYINLVLFAVFAPILVFLVPSYNPQSGSKLLERTKQIDWAGTMLILGAALTGIMAISFGGTLFVASRVLFIIFFTQQYFALFTTAENRIFPLQFLRNRQMVAFFFLIGAPGATVLGPIFYIPVYFSFVHNDSPMDAAIRLLPIIITFVCFDLGSGVLVSKTGRFYPSFMVGSILTTIGAVLIYADVNLTSSPGKLYGYSAIVGIGTGTAGQLSYSAAQFRVHPKDIAATIGFICLGQYTGITLALCISGAIFNNIAQDFVTALLPPGTSIGIIRAVIQGADYTFLATQSPETRLLILEAVIEAIKQTYPVIIAAGCLMIVTTLLLNPKDKVLFKREGG